MEASNGQRSGAKMAPGVRFSGGHGEGMLSGEGVCLHVFPARSIGYMEIELLKKRAPPGPDEGYVV